MSDQVSCRQCGKKGYQAEWRWFSWGANGYCSKQCWEQAKREYDEGDADAEAAA